MLDDFLCGVHKDQHQVHLGFGKAGLDLAPADFQKLMEAIADFDMEIILLQVHGIPPRASVVAYGMTVQWGSAAQQVRMQIDGSVRTLTLHDWNQVMTSLRTLLGCVARWQRGALLPKELELPSALSADDAAAAVAEAERMLREAHKPR
ncbi:MAG: hypothetical protein HY689_06400 [Chloroflexi bacterium]|nr:hypothetical protein [Chloroflexota bacterium]